MTIIEGQLVANEMKIGIVVSRFNELITSKIIIRSSRWTAETWCFRRRYRYCMGTWCF